MPPIATPGGAAGRTAPMRCAASTLLATGAGACAPAGGGRVRSVEVRATHCAGAAHSSLLSDRALGRQRERRFSCRSSPQHAELSIGLTVTPYTHLPGRGQRPPACLPHMLPLNGLSPLILSGWLRSGNMCARIKSQTAKEDTKALQTARPSNCMLGLAGLKTPACRQ